MLAQVNLIMAKAETKSWPDDPDVDAPPPSPARADEPNPPDGPADLEAQVSV